MLSTVLVIVIVVAIGSRAGDNLRLQQQETILSKLPHEEKYAYYEVLKRRVRKVQLLRAIALLSMLGIFYSYKYHLVPKEQAPPPSTYSSPR